MVLTPQPVLYQEFSACAGLGRVSGDYLTPERGRKDDGRGCKREAQVVNEILEAHKKRGRGCKEPLSKQATCSTQLRIFLKAQNLCSGWSSLGSSTGIPAARSSSSIGILGYLDTWEAILSHLLPSLSGWPALNHLFNVHHYSTYEKLFLWTRKNPLCCCCSSPRYHMCTKKQKQESRNFTLATYS